MWQPEWLSDLVERAAALGEDASESLLLAQECAENLPLPGNGETALRWAALSAISEANLIPGRVLEAHSDALAILAEAEHPVPGPGTWGVFAAEGPGVPLEARCEAGVWVFAGTKPWCSLADQLDYALVTAHVDAGRRLFRVDLRQPTVSVAPAETWVARGLRTVTSSPVTFDDTPVEPVGEVDWYLERPGFAWGGIGVAACWHGGAKGLASKVMAAAQSDDIGAYHRGAIDAALYAGSATLAAAAAAVDAGEADGDSGRLLALRVRAVVAEAAEKVLLHAGHALGPGPLAFDEAYAARVADLQLYVRQHHAERDLASLGSSLRGHAGS